MSRVTTASSARLSRGTEPFVVAVAVSAVIVVLLRTQTSILEASTLRNWSTVFMAMCVQAIPFLALGVIVSGAIAAFVPQGLVPRLLPRNPFLAVPVAGVAGIALPGCECGSVPIAGRLVAQGAAPAPALTFLLAAPAINPVVLIATSIAFPGKPEVVVARFTASLLAAVVIGWCWTRPSLSRLALSRVMKSHDHGGLRRRGAIFTSTTLHDFTMAGGYLVVGAALAASIQAVVPRGAVDTVAGNELASVLTMLTLAILLSICSEADAFVAAGLSQFTMTSRLVFLVVGPMLDLKLIAMQRGTFGGAFVRRFAPLTAIVCVASAVIVGRVLL